MEAGDDFLCDAAHDSVDNSSVCLGISNWQKAEKMKKKSIAYSH